MNDGSDEGFLSRWSRRKAQLRQTPAAPERPATEPAVALAHDVAARPPASVDPAPAAPAEQTASEARAPTAAPAVPPPTLEEARMLTPTSDFTRFVAPGVDKEVKNAAMKKLFADPHFNVMDGLDTYIDDYGKADPIPKAMLRQLVQARVLGLLDDDLEEQPQPVHAAAPEAVAPAEAADPAPETTSVAALEDQPAAAVSPALAPEAAPAEVAAPERAADGAANAPPAN